MKAIDAQITVGVVKAVIREQMLEHGLCGGVRGATCSEQHVVLAWLSRGHGAFLYAPFVLVLTMFFQSYEVPLQRQILHTTTPRL